jgi:AhpD family alkylhydroperoxidase
MNQRIHYQNVAPEALQTLYALEKYVRKSGLEPALIDLVKLRASQLNGCAYCVDMHSKDLRAAGESEERIFTLPVWRESPFYTDRERAAPAWTEALTNIQDGHAPGDVYAWARQQFSEKELVDLTMAIIAINGWNRLAISFRVPAGTYQPAHHAVKT